MSIFRNFTAIFVSPNKVFDQIREAQVGWWQPWLIVSVIMVIATVLMLPIQSAMIESNPELMAGGNADNAESMMKIAQIVQVVMSPVIVLVAALIVTAISYVMVTLMSKEATFKKYFTLILFADVVASVGFIATILILRARGIDTISSPEDMKAGLSLRMLAPDAGPVVSGILGSVEFFAIWGFALIAAGLRRMFGFSLGAAIACCIPLWLMYTLFTVVGEIFQGRQ